MGSAREETVQGPSSVSTKMRPKRSEPFRSRVRTEGVSLGEGRRGLRKGPMKERVGVVVHPRSGNSGWIGWC